MTDNEAIWKHIDKHRDEISDIKTDVHAANGRMTLLETRFDTFIANHSEGQARLELMLGSVQKDVSKLNDEKIEKKGYDKARDENKKLITWIIGLIVAMLGSGALSISFFGDKL